MKNHLVLGLAFLVLCGCSTADQTSGMPELFPAYESKDGVLRIPPLKLKISHPVALSTNQTYGNPFDVSGTGAQTFFIFRVVYNRESQGLEDWVIPQVIADQLHSDDICSIIGHAGTGVYLPLQADHLMQCAVFKNADGDRIIAAVGFSQTFEGPDHPGSMIIIPRKKDALVFSNLIAFPEFNLWLRKRSDMFYGQHTEDNLWPPITPAAKAFYNNATDYVGRMIAEPSKEVVDAMSELELWSNRLTLD